MGAASQRSKRRAPAAVQEQRLGALILPQAAQILGFGAEVLGGVMHQGSRRAEAGVVVAQAEALEIEDAQRVHDRFGAGGGLEMVIGQFGAQAARGKGVQRVLGRLRMGRRLPAGQLALGHEELRRVERGENGQQVFDLGIARDLELAGGQIEPGRLQAAGVERHGGEVMVVLGFELIGGEDGAGREDTSELALDQLARASRFLLVANRDLFAGGEQPADIILHGVEGEAGHGLTLALRQGEPEQAGGHRGVIEEQFVKISQAEEQQGVGGQPALHLEVLLHHRCGFRGLRHRSHSNG